MNSKFRTASNSYFFCNLICNLKSDSMNILCQLIWILLNDPIQIISIFFIYLSGKISSNPILCQKHHGTSHFLLFLKLYNNISCLPLRNSLYLSQAFAFLLNDPKGISLKFFYDSLCQSRSQSFNGSRSQITFHTVRIIWLQNLIGTDLKLWPMHRMIHILSISPYIFPFVNIIKNSNQCLFLSRHVKT